MGKYIKKKKKRVRKNSEETEEPKQSEKAQNALLYLRNWAKRSKGGEWKFQKNMQVYLQKHGLKTITDEKHFKRFCNYMKGSPEGVRSLLLKDAQKIIDDESGEDEGLQTRAKQLMKSLNDDNDVTQPDNIDS
jgi:hypothetical protein